jgi:hypothetical protein
LDCLAGFWKLQEVEGSKPTCTCTSAIKSERTETPEAAQLLGTFGQAASGIMITSAVIHYEQQ